MADEADQVLHVTDEPIIDENKSTPRAESDNLMTSSSSNATEAYRQEYHSAD
jgi:hypothetical protein